MSVPTTPAFIHAGTWSSITRAHPAMKRMENYTNEAIDGRAWTTSTPFSEWLHPDFLLEKSDGTILHGGEKVWSQSLSEIYGPFTQHRHDPNFFSLL